MDVIHVWTSLDWHVRPCYSNRVSSAIMSLSNLGTSGEDFIVIVMVLLLSSASATCADYHCYCCLKTPVRKAKEKKNNHGPEYFIS